MIETSKDLLFITLAFCAIWLTVFLCWLLYYVMAIIRDAETVMRQIKNVVDKVDGVAKFVQDKMEHSAASLTIIASALKELIMWAIAQRQEMMAKKKSSAKRKIAEEE
jgi:hypothetical protein